MIKAGEKAPQFKSKDQHGNEVTLAGLKGKKVVLYFYPKDMTPGCTAESCSLRDNYKALQKAGYEVFGISSDDEKSHRKFIEKEKLPFSLLADPDKSVHHQFGTWVEKSMYGRKYMGTARVTFIINEAGVVEEVIEKVDTKNHADQILNKKEAPLPSPKADKKVVSKKTTASSVKKTVSRKPAKRKR